MKKSIKLVAAYTIGIITGVLCSTLFGGIGFISGICFPIIGSFAAGFINGIIGIIIGICIGKTTTDCLKN